MSEPRKSSIIHAEIEALYDALNEYLDKLARLQSELREPPEDLVYLRLALGRIALSLKKMSSYIVEGKSIIAESEACSLSRFIASLLVGRVGVRDQFIESSRTLLAATKGLADRLCRH